MGPVINTTVGAKMSDRSQRLTRRQQRLADKSNSKEYHRVNTHRQLHFELKDIRPKTHNQELAFDAYQNGDHLFLLGCAGTGKTFLSLFLALSEIESGRSPRNKIMIIRSPQPAKQIGFLPGDKKEKTSEYETPYRDICAELYHRDDAYDILKTKGIIEFQPTSFLRGTNIPNAIVIFDELQNGTFAEIRTVLTRVADQSRIIMIGDTKQDDLTSKRYNEESGIHCTLKVFANMDENITRVDFDVRDVLRSGFVKSFIIAENKTKF
jgi:phosphate starvation-inducible protein PhoH